MLWKNKSIRNKPVTHKIFNTNVFLTWHSLPCCFHWDVKIIRSCETKSVEFLEGVDGNEFVKIEIIEKMRDIHVDVDCLEVERGWVEKKLNHIWGMSANWFMFFIITISICVIIEAEPELGQLLKVFTARFQKSTIYNLKSWISRDTSSHKTWLSTNYGSSNRMSCPF